MFEPALTRFDLSHALLGTLINCAPVDRCILDAAHLEILRKRRSFPTTGFDHLVWPDTLIAQIALRRILALPVGACSDVATMVMTTTQPA